MDKNEHWPHAPSHVFIEQGSYMVTGATYQKEKLFQKKSELDLLQNYLFELALKYGWQLEAWAIFSNHYHFIAQSTNPNNLKIFIRHLHSVTAIKLNTLHNTPGRKIWYQYWDTRLDFHKSYLARLNYVTNNPVKHGLVKHAELYPWCSASWLEKYSSTSYYKTVTKFKTDALNISDDY